MKIIILTHDKVAYVDDEDYDKVQNYKWVASPSRESRFYARVFLKSGFIPRPSILLQHLIVGKAPKGHRIFFKDNNPLNCQKENIEFISFAQAGHNYYKKCKSNKNTKENFKGVSVLFIAKIKHNGKPIMLGNFNSEREAAQAYNAKAVELFGDKAVLNKV
jgi:hypothetical protein